MINSVLRRCAVTYKDRAVSVVKQRSSRSRR